MRISTRPVRETLAVRSTGEAVNLSDGGACLALDDTMLAIGDELIVWLHSGQARQAVPATGRVVWTASDRGCRRCGLEWTHRGPQRRWIGWLTEV